MTATASMLDGALGDARRGWHVFPLHTPAPDGGCSCRNPRCTDVGKHPRTKHGLSDATTDEGQIARWWGMWGEANIGIRTGAVSSIVVLDIDPDKGGHETLAGLCARHGALPETIRVITGGQGEHTYLAHPGGHIPNSIATLGPGLDVRGDGGYVVAPGSLHRSGRRYAWEVSGHPEDVDLAPMPVWLVGLVRKQSSTRSTGATPSGDRIPEGQRNKTLFRAGCAMRRHGLNESAILAALLADNAERCDPPLPEEDVRKIAASCVRYGPAETGGGASFSANGHGPTGTARTAPPSPDEGLVNLTDLGNGRRLVARHGRDLLHCDLMGAWQIWDGQRFARDETGEIDRRAKDTALHMHAQARAVADDEARRALIKWALRSESGAARREMIKAAGSEVGVAVAPAVFDADPWLLNVANGTIDLRTGELRPADRADRLTKLAPVVYDPAAQCPAWLGFLDRIMDGKQEVIDFLQRAAGYSLTGDIGEHCLFLAFGTGRNGKSTFVETLGAAVGDYAMTTSTDTLLVKRNSGIPNDLARLVGARLVSASESEAGRNLAEALVKQLTGGDTISARFLNHEFFDFKPAFKLWFRTNHKPTIKGTDDGIWTRIRLIPFTQRIPDGEIDKRLPDRLLAELPGILAWAVRGCLMWQRDGLGMPTDVAKATAEYRNEMDILGAFLADGCVVGQDLRCTAKDLYAAYVKWAEESGERAMSQKGLSLRLNERGFVSAKGTGGTRMWAGLKVAGGG